jgi:hypothetical protein
VKHPRSNTKEAQLERLLDAVSAKGLTVYEITVEPKCIRLRTQPLGESAMPEDAADRWLRGRANADKAGRRA